MGLRAVVKSALVVGALMGVGFMPTMASASAPCAACRASDSRVQVSFSPVTSTNRAVFDDISILDPAGSPLDPSLYEVIPSSDGVGNASVTGPVVMVDPTVGFAIDLNGRAARDNQPFTITVISRGETRSVELVDLNSALTGRIQIDPVGTLVFRGGTLRRVRIIQTFETPGASYRFVGTQATVTTPASVSLRTATAGTRVIFRDTQRLVSVWTLRLSSTTLTSVAAYHLSNVKVARGDQIVVTYGAWQGSRGRPVAWLDRHSDGHLDLRLPLTKG